MGRSRKRSISGGSHKDMMMSGSSSQSLGTRTAAFGASSSSSSVSSSSNAAARGGGGCNSSISNDYQRGGLVAAKELLEAILQRENAATGRYFLHDCCLENNNQRRRQQDEKLPEQQEQKRDCYTAAEGGAEQQHNALLSLAAGLLTRAQQVDSSSYNAASHNSSNQRSSSSSSSSKSSERSSFLRRFLLQRDAESGYSPLHSAVHRGDLALILLFLRTAALAYHHSHDEQQQDEARITQRPMLMLHQVGLLPTTTTTSITKENASQLPLLQAMVTAVDDEGFTAADLLAALQRKHLLACRLSLPRAKIIPLSSTQNNANNSSGGRRRSSFDLAENENDGDHDDDEQNQNEFNLLSRHLPALPNQVTDNVNNNSSGTTRNNNPATTTTTTFGCEVITFGLDHHCALGVGATTNASSSSVVTTTAIAKSTTATSSSSTTSLATASSAAKLIRPQRVQALAPRPGQKQGAVAVAAAAHHTLVVMGRRDSGGHDNDGKSSGSDSAGGHLYAFGLGRGGRLGTGHETPCPTPTRIRGPLQGRVVVGVAAAENHSLCVTQCGNVYAWGSNRFGQIGIAATTTSTTTGDGGVGSGSTSMRLLPRRVDDLKQVHCVAVAAGEKHSVALSNQGQVYVWGDNTAGQLGISRRTGIHKVQRVESLWKSSINNSRACCIAIAASEQATLALAIPDSSRARGSLALPVNAIYAWGHGSHVPSKVHFVERGTGMAKTEFSTKPSRPINPVSIACARYHNVAITSDGEVYTWGLHAEPLGTRSKKSLPVSTTHPNNNTSLIMASPQLVKGMLPENGGGIAVAVSACENHTAVVTDTGALYTWGSTHGKNILGHEGVSWQPDPKKVPGVHRAVGIAVAKEHTVLLVGTVFPPIPDPEVEATTALPSPQPTASQPSLSLEDLAARKAAEYVDLFNVLSVLITAERANCPFLVHYCMEFYRCNLDGVLNVGQKSVLNTYLKEQLMSSLVTRPLLENRDAHIHPFLTTSITASTPRYQDEEKSYPIFVLEQTSRLSAFQDWLQGCESLVQEPHVVNMIVHSRNAARKTSSSSAAPRVRFHSSSPLAQALSKRDSTAASTSVGPRVVLGASEDLCKEISLLKNMDLATMTKAKVEDKQESLTRELRGIRKRIGQIDRLQAETNGVVLSAEQREKLARRPQLETYLQALEPALSSVENKLMEFLEKEKLQIPTPTLTVPEKDEATMEEQAYSDLVSSKSLRCDVCGITCPDIKSHTLHLNGRKHRNRVALMQEEEQRKAASLMMEEQQRQLLVGIITRSQETPVTTVGGSNPWGASSSRSHKSNTPSVHYQLSPPPHRTPESLVPIATRTPQKLLNPAASAKPSLLEIMAEEQSRHSAVQKRLPRAPTVAVVAKIPTAGMNSPAKIPSLNLTLPAGSAPPLKLPPWVTKPVAAVASPSINLLSLGDFVLEQPKPAATCNRRRSNSGASWGSPNKPTISSHIAPQTPVAVAAVVVAKSLIDIQQQEQEFQDKEDQTFASNGKWFIERRERAHSFRDIENDANKEREDRLFLEEQFRIESMIRAEHEKAKKEEQQETKGNRRRWGSESCMNKGVGNNRNRNNKSRSNNKDNGQQHRKKAPPGDKTATTQKSAAADAKADNT